VIDPVVGMVVGALVQGVLSGFAQRAGEDGYTTLKGYLIRQYGGGVQAGIARLEAAPQSPQYQEEMAQRLQQVGADRDPELLRLARELTDLVEHPERWDQPGAAPPDPVEDLRRATGVTAVGRLLEEHVGRVLRMRSEHRLEDRDLLCRNIRNNKDVPQAVRDNAVALHGRMREIIARVAASIEEARYREVEAAVATLPAGLVERQRAAKLVQADKQLHVSYETLRVTVEFFSELNRGVLARIESDPSRHRQANMMFGNAVMIYELTDYVIGYIQSFGLGDELTALRAEAKKRVDEARRRQNDLAGRIATMEIEPAVRDQALADIRDREGALDELDREWDRYLGEVGDMRAKVDEIRRKVPTLEIIRESAEIQIMTLQLVAMLSFLRQSSESIRGAVDTLQGFRLAPLSATRVRRLLGV
jgi:hypothetical protein